MNLLDKLERNLLGGINSKHTDFPFRIKNELDFPVYRNLYENFFDYFDIPIPGINSIKIELTLKSTLLRNNLLEFFSNELTHKLNLQEVVGKNVNNNVFNNNNNNNKNK
jgi:hypothetical protein